MTESKFSPALITGLALVIAALIFGWFYYSAQSVANNKDSLSVTGSAKVQVTSDQAKLVIALTRIVASSDLASGYSGVAHDLTL
jgi:hypothetical protein